MNFINFINITNYSNYKYIYIQMEDVEKKCIFAAL